MTDKLREALERLMPLFEKSMRELVFTAEKAGEVTADMNTLRAALAAPVVEAAQTEPRAYMVTRPVDVGVGMDRETVLRWESGLEEYGEESVPLYEHPALATQPQAEGVVVTQANVDAARALILECTAKQVLSGDGPAKRSDRTWVYERLCEAAGLLVGTVSTRPPAVEAEPVAWGSFFPSGVCAQATANPSAAEGWRRANGDVRPLFLAAPLQQPQEGWNREAAMEKIAAERIAIIQKADRTPAEADRLAALTADLNALSPRVTQSMIDDLRAMTAELRKLQEGWVSVEERLPEVSDWYLVTIADPQDIGWETKRPWMAWFEAGEWLNCDPISDGQPVTHWRPALTAAAPSQGEGEGCEP